MNSQTELMKCVESVESVAIVINCNTLGSIQWSVEIGGHSEKAIQGQVCADAKAESADK